MIQIPTRHFQNVTRFFHGESLRTIFRDQGIHEDDKTIQTIYSYDGIQLEEDRSFIQWVFPTPRASRFNGNAPVLTLEDIGRLRTDREKICVLQKFYLDIMAYD
eukprot:gene71-77_t